MSDITDIITLYQFSFITCDSLLSSILLAIADAGINISGYNQVKEKKHEVVRIIPGVTGESQTREEIDGVSEILKKHGVKFCLKYVLGVLTPDIPGQLARIQSLLFCRVCIHAVYRDRSERNIYDVNDNEKATYILENASKIEPCYPLVAAR